MTEEGVMVPPKEADTIRQRCTLVEPGVVVMRDLPKSNLATFQTFMAVVREHTAPFKRFAIVNDITEADSRPRGEHQDAIIKAATTMGVHWAIVLPGNV